MGHPRPEFGELVERHRAELHAHCYRMLGSVFDADDALQETLLRAWRGVDGLRDDASARAWLYRIATNVCLTEIGRRRKRVLPHDFGPPVSPHTPPGLPAVESVWLEPYGDPAAQLTDGAATPESRYEQREAIELAFVAAVQTLPPNQRAVLILREVLGFSAREAAQMLETTVASVNSALQRARDGVRDRIPERTQQATLRTLGDRALRELIDRYVDAWERNDVDAFTALLVDDATFAMPPLSTWYAGREAIGTWARGFPLSGLWRWKTVLTHANAQPALAFYAWDEGAHSHLPFALNVLTFRDGRVSDVTAFIIRSSEGSDPEALERMPQQPLDERSYAGVFSRLALPAQLD